MNHKAIELFYGARDAFDAARGGDGEACAVPVKSALPLMTILARREFDKRAAAGGADGARAPPPAAKPDDLSEGRMLWPCGIPRGDRAGARG